VRHEKAYHKIRRIYSCTHCGEIFYTPEDLKLHSERHIASMLNFKLYKSVFNGMSEIYRKRIHNEDTQDPFEMLSNEGLLNEIQAICIHQAIRRKRMYFNTCSHCVFLKMDESGDIIDKITFVANTKNIEMNFTHTKSDIEK